GDRVAVLDPEAARMVHPGVDGDDEGRPRHAGDRDRYAAQEVSSRREPVPAVDVDPDEDRLEEEREALEREAEAEYVPEARDEVRPEQAELEAQDRAGDDADGEQRQHHVRPAPRHRAVELTARTQVARLGEEH